MTLGSNLSRRALLLSAAAASTACRRAKPRDLRKLSVAVGSFHTMSPFYLAQERGYFRDEGLDIAITVARSAAEAMPLMAQGALDAGLFVNSPGLCNLIAQGARVRIVASREFMTNCIDIGVLYESRKSFPAGDQQPRSWQGKRVALQSRGSISHYSFEAVRQSLSVPPDAVRVMFLDRAAGLAALLSGGVDAMINGFALPLDLGSRGADFSRNDAAPRILQGLQYSYILFSKNLLDGPQDLGASFLKAYFRGTREYLGGATPVFLENWVRDNGMDRDALLKLCRATLVPDGSVNVADLQKYVDWLAALNYIQPMPAESLVDLRWQAGASRGRA